MITEEKQFDNKKAYLTILVAALGYFVDIYDLLLFSIVRKPSLKDLKVPDDQLANVGLLLLDWQMVGLLIGGFFWGIMGDKKGRLSVLFGSILMYSLANLANGFVQDIETYKVLRFIAGIGLAGELGAGITLVSEMMSKEKRAYGTTIMTCIGILGAVLAYFVSQIWDWRFAYIFGGVMGLALLLLRVSLSESGFFKSTVDQHVSRGNFFALLKSKTLFFKYLYCNMLGLLTWFVIGILVTLSPEIAKNCFGMTAEISGGKAIMWCYLGTSLGDLVSGLLSQILKSRKKSLWIFVIMSVFAMMFYLMSDSTTTSNMLYGKIFFLGFAVGYWALFVSVSSEHFGTNLRATVTTTVPNFARAFLIPISMLYYVLRNQVSILETLTILACFCSILVFIGLYNIEETYAKDLDFIEEEG